MAIKVNRNRFTIASITLSVIGITCFLLVITIVISPFNMKLYHTIGSICFKLSLVFFPASFVLGIVGFFRKDSKVGVYAILSVVIGGLFTLLMLLTLTIFAGYYLITKEKPIHKAAYKGNLKKVKQIIDKDPAQVNVQDWQDHTPLYFASCKGHTEIVDFLLAHNANTELGNNLGERPLSVAAEYGHYNTIKALLMHGAKVNCKDVFDRTPLHEAAVWSGKEVINILISYGADVSAKDDDNDTPLHQAAMLNNIEAAKALVENGADLFAKNDYDYAKLYIAATKDNNEAAKELLRRGTASYRSNKNKTPKEIALKCGFKELAQYLQTKEDEKRLGVGLTSLSIYSKYMDREKTDALKWVLEGDYEIVTSFYDLPKKIQDKILPPPSFPESLRAAYIRNLDLSEKEIEKIIDRYEIIYGRMAEPNQPFNRSDIIVEALPTCRFTIGGFSEDRAFLVYEEGGYVYNQKFIVLKRNRSIDILFFGYCWSFVFSLEQLKSAIDSGQIYVAPNRAYWIF